MIPDIVSALDKYMEGKITIYPRDVNRSHDLGHPCERYLTYARTHWKERLKHDVGLQYIFNEGNMHEPAVLALLGKAGFHIVQNARPFDWKAYELRGKIDAAIQIDEGRPIPFDVKSISPWNFDTILDEASIRNHKEHYVRGYYDQMQAYMLFMEVEESFLLFKNKQTGRFKQVNIHLDYTYCEEKILKKLTRVNSHVHASTLPERIEDRDICADCGFRHICLPDVDFDGVIILNDDQLMNLIVEELALKAAANDYKEVHEKVLEQLKTREEGTHLLNGQIEIVIKKGAKFNYKARRIDENQNKATTGNSGAGAGNPA